MFVNLIKGGGGGWMELYFLCVLKLFFSKLHSITKMHAHLFNGYLDVHVRENDNPPSKTYDRSRLDTLHMSFHI